MQSGVLGYRLYRGQSHTTRWHLRSKKNGIFLKIIFFFVYSFVVSRNVLLFSSFIWKQKGLPSLPGGGQVDGSPPASIIRIVR